MKKKEVKLTNEQLKLKERIEYGDIQKMCTALEFSRMHITRVFNGERDEGFIWDYLEIFLNDRDARRETNISQLNS